jgi:hypothetical protein
MSEAWVKAEQLKKEKEKMRKQAEKNRKRGKLHSQQSINEEKLVKTIVNHAWKEVTGNTPNKLYNICENAMENESSYENESDSDSVTPNISTQAEVRQQRLPVHQTPDQSSFIEQKLDANESHIKPEVRKTRRSRANRKCSQDKTSSKAYTFSQLNHSVVEVKKSPFKESNTNTVSREAMILVSNLDPNFNEEDLLISPVKENRQLLFENYLTNDY